jgi:hypothetical protein
MDKDRLLRDPFRKVEWFTYDTIRSRVSPNSKFSLLFSHSREGSMMNYECLFTLTENSESIIDNFEPLTAIADYYSCWKADSTVFALALSRFAFGYLLVKVPSLELGFIRVFNPYPLEVAFIGESFRISYKDDSVRLTNSMATFKAGETEIPKKIYTKPKDVVIDLNDINFYSRVELDRLGELTADQPLYNLELIEDGFREFKGIYPQNTKQIYNTRQLEIYHLEAFAEYGDPVSVAWIDEIRAKTNGDYSRWDKVYDYLGFLQR